VLRLIYFLLRALRNMRQSPFLCTAAVGTVTVSLVILAFFALVVLNVEQLTRQWSGEVQVVAYLDQLPPGRELDQQINRIRKFPQVASVNYVSPEEAFARFEKRLAADADLLQGVAHDFLPASLEIGLNPDSRNRDGVAAVIAELRQDPRFADLRYGQDWLERFEAFLALLRLTGLILGGFLLFAALFIVSNTIKLTLFARRDELEVMALVGATPAFIKTPFLIEGAFQGLLGGLLALLASFGLHQIFLREDLTRLLVASGIGEVSFLPLHWQLLLVGAGGALGLFGSLFSLRRLVRI